MKKTLAIFLSVLLICISIAPMSFAVNEPGITTRVMDGSYLSTNAGDEEITASTFTLAIKMPAVEKLVGVTLHLTFDPNVLAVAEAGLAGSTDAAGNFNEFFSGVGVCGLQGNTNNSYGFGWIHSTGLSKSGARDIFYITFNVIDTTKTETSLNLYIDEFITEDGDDTNDVKASLLAENKIVNFNFGDDVEIVVPDTTVSDSDNGGNSGVSDVNGLLQIIRDILSGNGATFGDFADAMANLLGNAEIADMIEMLVDGDFNLSLDFNEILGGFGLDFGSLEDLLNKIIEFFANLFGAAGGDSTTNSSSMTTAAGGSDLDTTSAGSSTGSEQTGDVGIALAATVCVAATVGFVLTRKKKENS